MDTRHPGVWPGEALRTPCRVLFCGAGRVKRVCLLPFVRMFWIRGFSSSDSLLRRGGWEERAIKSHQQAAVGDCGDQETPPLAMVQQAPPPMATTGSLPGGAPVDPGGGMG